MKTKHFSFFVASFLAVSIANAAINIDTVLVGDAGNPADPLNSGSLPGIGSVSYEYYIGIYEVTNAQYTAFLNSVAASDPYGLYDTDMANIFSGGIARSGSSGSYTYSAISGRENNPVNYVNFWDAARFTNWLTTGDTETGVYNLGGIKFPVNNTIARNNAAWLNGGVAIASENEWYKAAYYSGSPTGADGDGYWLYPTQSNSISTADANYAVIGSPIAVGTYAGNSSHYGTFDQGGNLWEWNDKIFTSTPPIPPLSRVARGGSCFSSFDDLQSSNSGRPFPSTGNSNIGFRVTSLEPITETNEVVPVFGLPWLIVLIASMLGLGYRKIR